MDGLPRNTLRLFVLAWEALERAGIKDPAAHIYLVESNAFSVILFGKTAFTDEQVSYFQDVLAKYPDVRWTFLFVHRPVWQADKPDPGFMAIEAALKGRPYTVFAGHAHTYEYQQLQGMDYIRLSTTGGAWLLDPPGNFDHIAWVTVTDEGPVVGNITLDGIFDKTGERKPVRDSFQ